MVSVVSISFGVMLGYYVFLVLLASYLEDLPMTAKALILVTIEVAASFLLVFGYMFAMWALTGLDGRHNPKAMSFW